MLWTWLIVGGISVAAASAVYCFVQWLGWREARRIYREMEAAERRRFNLPDDPVT
jgi:hypothetical protein